MGEKGYDHSYHIKNQDLPTELGLETILRAIRSMKADINKPDCDLMLITDYILVNVPHVSNRRQRRIEFTGDVLRGIRYIRENNLLEVSNDKRRKG